MGTREGEATGTVTGSPATALGRMRAVLGRRPLAVDAVLYLGCACYALVLALTDKHLGYRVWGAFAVAGYSLALTHTCWLAFGARRRAADSLVRSRWTPVAIVGLVGMLAPLATLVTRRAVAGGDWASDPGQWHAQPEVWVIERSADTLLATGTPYLDLASLGHAPGVYDYAPYGPVMAVFGLPRALFGGHPVTDALTDARLVFAAVAVGCVLAALRLWRPPAIPVGAAQLAAVFPLTALTWATAGPDLAIVALVVLALALAATGRPVSAALVCGLVTHAKLIAAPAAVVIGVLVAVRLGGRALARYIAGFAGATVVLVVPVLLVNPGAFTEHVLLFPAGLAAVTSPAASPFPGHLLAGTGPVGTVLAFVLLAGAGVAVLAWLVRTPPRTAADAALRIAVALAAFTLLATATRFGYLVYVSVLLGAVMVFRSRAEVPLGTVEPGSGSTGDRAPPTSS
ncbi:glycosyltransferase family 87 protein [Saccharomonospora piscinae]|uniref:glycosyltransferase family 87 protein n=1 Tax=Saccharomonospora piscinae TaxID=687388 RepID=UPI00046667DC|nr:glycosyltransferase family 87 protein [Saccharomonospora piscinae]